MSVSKIVGYVLILVGCSGLGLWYSVQMQQKVWHLKEMLRILDIVISEIDYGHSTLPECCERIREKTADPYKDVFHKLCEGISSEDGTDFGKMAEETMRQALKEVPLGEEKEAFIKSFTDVGYADGWLQRRNVERGKQDLQGCLSTEEEDLKKRSKLAVSLGTMSGILLVLILL